MKHSPHCKNCKIKVTKLLAEIFGEIKQGYNLGLPSKIEHYKNELFYNNLDKIYKKLQHYRNYKKFVFVKKLPNVDFFAIQPGIIIEFDEPQHFTELRKIALSTYQNGLNLWFDKDRWQSLCTKLNRKDNNPFYRDEQRAWYDTLRDFAPKMLNLKPTIRLYASDFVWCSLNPTNESDIEMFKNIIKKGKI
jgi:hypothetical protein